MPYIKKEQLEQAREMDLLTYLQSYEPHELKHIRGEVYCTQTHDSLKISNGKWMWWSQGIGGRTALDYLVKVQGMSLPEAVERILGKAALSPPVYPVSETKAQPKMLLLPPKHSDCDLAAAYLLHRGIAPGLIQFCIDTGRLYESSPHHNVVFVGRDTAGKPRYANLRGIQSDFKGEASGSDKRYSFSIPAEGESDTLHLFESAIDALSFATLLRLHRREWNGEHLLSLAGVYQPKKELKDSKIPVALTQFLTDYPRVQRIVLRLDSDSKGRIAAAALKEILPTDYTIEDKPPPIGKDYSDYLQHVCQQRRQECGRGNAR